jgi:hypothetical protein
MKIDQNTVCIRYHNIDTNKLTLFVSMVGDLVDQWIKDKILYIQYFVSVDLFEELKNLNTQWKIIYNDKKQNAYLLQCNIDYFKSNFVKEFNIVLMQVK